MRLIVFVTVASVTVMPRRLRLRALGLQPFRRALPPCERMTFPVADVFMRFTAHFFVFILGIVASLFFRCLPRRSGSRFWPDPDGRAHIILLRPLFRQVEISRFSYFAKSPSRGIGCFHIFTLATFPFPCATRAANYTAKICSWQIAASSTSKFHYLPS